MLKALNNNEMELAKARVNLATLKNELKMEEAKLQLLPKEEWKELGISNAEGRKAYIMLETEELVKKVLEASNRVICLEAELNCLQRLYDATKEE